MKYAQMDIIHLMVFAQLVTLNVKHVAVEQMNVVILALLPVILSGTETHVSIHALMVNGLTLLEELVMIVMILVLPAQLETTTIVTVVMTHII